MSEFAAGHFAKTLFAAGHIATVNLQRGILQMWIFTQSYCDSEFAAGISRDLQRVILQKLFAAGMRLNLQRVILQN